MNKENNKEWVTIKEITTECGIGKSQAYTVMRRLNTELEAMGKITFRGRIPRRYYEERIF